jgi:hypothetical protein
VHGIARDGLLNLSEQRLGIADEEIANVRALLEFSLQNLDRDAKQAALQLDKTSIEGDAAIHGRVCSMGTLGIGGGSITSGDAVSTTMAYQLWFV